MKTNNTSAKSVFTNKSVIEVIAWLAIGAFVAGLAFLFSNLNTFAG